MNTAFAETPEIEHSKWCRDPLSDYATGDSDVLRIRTKSDWIGDILGFIVLIGFSFFLLVAGLELTSGPARWAGVIILICGVLGITICVRWIFQRTVINLDRQPKLSLSPDGLCDHRTGIKVALAEVDSIRFVRKCFRFVETKADLYLIMEDGIEHVFELRQLDLSSKEIAWRVVTNAEIEKAEGVCNPAEETIGTVGYVIFGLLAAGLLKQVYHLTVALVAAWGN